MLIRSGRTAMRYLGPAAPPLRDSEGFLHTRDMVERRGERWHFVGRRDGVVNVGGLKVHPEEVEALINRHDRVRASLVKGRPNPITGNIVVAEIVLNSANIDEVDGEQAAAIKDEIFAMCRGALPSHKVPATIRVVAALEMSPGGKLVRRNA
jgi:acyl-coenzyme A synthetase/AMP-(fatty) acid ligase